LNTEKGLVWRQDSHAATVRSFGRNSYGLVWRPSPGIFAAVEIPVTAQQRRRPAGLSVPSAGPPDIAGPHVWGQLQQPCQGRPDRFWRLAGRFRISVSTGLGYGSRVDIEPVLIRIG